MQQGAAVRSVDGYRQRHGHRCGLEEVVQVAQRYELTSSGASTAVPGCWCCLRRPERGEQTIPGRAVAARLLLAVGLVAAAAAAVAVVAASD